MNLKLLSPLIVLLVLLMFSCDSSSDPEVEPDMQTYDDEVVNVDESNPIINVEGLGDVLESKSTITVSLQDESSVLTKIEVNGEEIFESSQKNFEFVLNPYSIPVGDGTVRVLAEDEFGNTAELSFAIEIKHFLMNFNLSVEEFSNFEFIWVFFNDLEGNLLSTKKLEQGSNMIYTDEVFAGETLYYTVSKYQLLGGGQTKNVRTTTYNITPAQTRYELTNFPSFSLDNYVQINVNRIVDDNGFSIFSASGSGYDTFTFGGGSFLTIVGVSFDNPKNIFLRTDVIGGTPALYDGKKEGYVYKKIEPSLSTPTLEIDEVDLIPAQENVRLDIPEHMPGSFVFTRVGFENQESMLANINHEIMEVQEPNDQYRDYIDLPILQELDLYNNTINYFINGKSFFAFLYGNDLDVEMPEWETSYRIENGQILVTASADADYHVARLYKDDFSDINNQRSFIWDYRTFGGTAEEQVALILEFPEEVKESFGDAFFTNTQDLDLTAVSSLDFAQFNTYEDTIRWLAVLEDTNLTIDQRSYRSVGFLPPTQTGKGGSNTKIETKKIRQ